MCRDAVRLSCLCESEDARVCLALRDHHASSAKQMASSPGRHRERRRAPPPTSGLTRSRSVPFLTHKHKPTPPPHKPQYPVLPLRARGGSGGGLVRIACLRFSWLPPLAVISSLISTSCGSFGPSTSHTQDIHTTTLFLLTHHHRHQQHAAPSSTSRTSVGGSGHREYGHTRRFFLGRHPGPPARPQAQGQPQGGTWKGRDGREGMEGAEKGVDG